MYYNKIMLGGNLTKDCELKQSQSGQSIATFTIAVNKSYKDKNGDKVEKAIFPNCVLFGKGAEALAPYLEKGKGVFVEGELSLESYDKDGEKKYATKVIVKEVRFTGGKPEGKPVDEPNEAVEDTDEIPF